MIGSYDENDLQFRELVEKMIMNTHSETRSSVMTISSVCDVLAKSKGELSPEQYEECLNQITIGCCRLMKVTELTSKLSTVLFNKTTEITQIDINGYLADFADNCCATLGTVCKVVYDPPPEGNIPFETSVDFLEYLLLVCVRKAVLDDAKVFNITLKKKPESLVIIIQAPDSTPDKIRPKIFKMSAEDLVAINSTLACKINGMFYCKGDTMILKLANDRPIKPILKSPEYSYPVKVFTSYHNMLSDLGEFRFY